MTKLKIATEIILIIFFILNLIFWRFNRRNLAALIEQGKEVDKALAIAQKALDEANKRTEK